MRKRTRNTSQSKRLVVTEKDSVYVGLDVHKKTVHAALRVNGQEIETWSMPMDVTAVVHSLERFKAGLRRIVYEAGPTGYGLVRALQEAGMPADVVAPGKIPRPANRDSKTDRLDCRMLAEFAEKHLLRKVAVPTEEEEADRQVFRLRDQLTKKIRRVKQQIKSLLLQYGVPQPEGLKHWTLEGIAALGTLEVRPQIRLTLGCLVDELRHLTEVRKRSETARDALLRGKRHREQYRRLRTHPAVGPTLGIAFLTEVYQRERFANSQAVTRFVALAPRVSQSGQTRRDGPLMKAGQAPLRTLLIQASWRWIGKETWVREYYDRICRNTGCSQKAIVAVARKFVVILWTMLVREETYRQAG